MRYKCYLILVGLVLVVNKAYSMDTKKYLELQIDSESVKGFVKFNDVVVFDELKGGVVNHKLPVNHWLVEGENTISIAIKLSREGDKADEVIRAAQGKKLNLAVNLRVEEDGSSNTYTLSNFNIAPSIDSPELIGSSSTQNRLLSSKDCYKASESGDVKIGNYIRSLPNKNWITFDMSFTLVDLGIPKWAFLEGDVIDSKGMSDEEFFAISDSLYLKYQELWALFKAKDTEKLLKYIEQRASEYDAAYHLPQGDKLKEMKRSLDSAFNHGEISLSDMVPAENANLRVMANGRIAKLKVAGAGEPLIYYSHERGSFTRFYDFYFMRKNGEWIIIR